MLLRAGRIWTRCCQSLAYVDRQLSSDCCRTSGWTRLLDAVVQSRLSWQLSTVAHNELLACRRRLAPAPEHVAIAHQSAVNNGIVTGDGPSMGTEVEAMLAVKPGGKCLYLACGLVSEP